jgi:5'-3' exoribonuclease 1
MSKQQQIYYKRVRDFIVNRKNGPKRIYFPPGLPARDRTFIVNLAKELGVQHGISLPEFEEGSSSNSSSDESYPVPCLNICWDEDDDDEDEESEMARMRILKRYDAANVFDEGEIAKNLEVEAKQRIEEEFVDWKKDYYKVTLLH